MRIIKIYNKDFDPLTSFTEGDFTKLNYRRVIGEIGDAQFTVRLDREKMTDENLELYNRIEIYDDGVLKFLGVITRRVISIDTAEIRCREIGYIFKKRLLGENYAVSGDIDAVVADLIDDVNADEDTGITLGDVTGATGNVNTTFNQANAFDILKQICKATGNQFEFAPDRTLRVVPSVGEDKSETVVFKYHVGQVSASNILSFEIEDDGDDIVTKVYGKSGGNSSAQENSGLKTKYGLLETYKDFRVVNTSGVLDEFTAAEIRDRIYSPDLDLNPKIEDNFEVGDIVRIVLKNSLVDLDDSFQVLEKRVQYNGDQRRISVRINDLPNYLASILSDRDRRLELLEKEL